MSIFEKIVNGTVDDNIYKRIGWIYVSYILVFVPIVVLSYLLLPDGILRGKHPIMSTLEFSPNLWVSTIQIFAYNLIPISLIIAANLLAQRSRISKNRFLPIGYIAFWGITFFWGLILGTWSFEVVTEAPPLYLRLIRGFDILHYSGFYELSAYLLAAVTSFRFILWYSDGKDIIASKRWGDIKLSKSEKIIFVFAFILLLTGAFIESYGIIKLTE